MLLLLLGCDYTTGPKPRRCFIDQRRPFLSTHGDTLGWFIQRVRVPCDSVKR